MKTIRILFLASTFWVTSLFTVQAGQFRTLPPPRIFYGGSLGLSLGDITQIDVMPVVGVWLLPQWSVGVGGRYSFFSHKSYVVGGSSSSQGTHIWGTSVFTQLLPIIDFSEVTPIKIRGGVFFHAEYERLLIDKQRINPFVSASQGKSWVELTLLGVGYRQRLGEKAALNIMLLWEVSKSDFSPYPNNPMLRVNITL